MKKIPPVISSAKFHSEYFGLLWVKDSVLNSFNTFIFFPIIPTESQAIQGFIVVFMVTRQDLNIAVFSVCLQSREDALPMSGSGYGMWPL